MSLCSRVAGRRSLRQLLGAGWLVSISADCQGCSGIWGSKRCFRQQDPRRYWLWLREGTWIYQVDGHAELGSFGDEGVDEIVDGAGFCGVGCRLYATDVWNDAARYSIVVLNP